MKRKTYQVEQLIELVNRICKESLDSPDFRDGAIVVLDTVLHETGNYSGFRYLCKDEVPNGAQPGVNYIKNEQGIAVPHPDYDLRFANTDRTRVQY